MSTPQNELDVDESSGVTALRPVPSKPARLFELSESDSTHYFSATELLERGKALAAARAVESAAEPTPESATEPQIASRRAGWLVQFQRASVPRKAIAILLPLASGLLLAKPLLRKPEQRTPDEPGVKVAAPTPPSSLPPTPALPSASASPLASLPRGVTAAPAAADSVARGDLARAASLYRELSRREPQNAAYREAARILGERSQTQAP